MTFAISIGLIILILGIFAHEIGPFVREVHRRQIQPVAFHLWRFRWAYVLIAVLIANVYGFYSNNSEKSNVLQIIKSTALISVLVALPLMWLLSVLNSYARGRLQWLVALCVFPPLALILFFSGNKKTK